MATRRVVSLLAAIKARCHEKSMLLLSNTINIITREDQLALPAELTRWPGSVLVFGMMNPSNVS
jgi:hypothetical protein